MLLKRCESLNDALTMYERWAPDLKRRTVSRIGHDINRFIRVVGDVPPRSVSTEHFTQLRHKVVDGYSATTVEGTIATILTLLRFLRDIGLLETIPHKGRLLRKPQPSLIIPTVEELGKLYDSTRCTRWPRLVWDRPQWWRCWLATAYFTGLRLHDLWWLCWSQIQQTNGAPARIEIVAEKTQKRHVIPLHPVLEKHLETMPQVNDRIFVAAKSSRKQFRRELKRMCDHAGVSDITPQQLRRLSVNQWEIAKPGCGLLIQGSGFRGSARYYLDPFRILFEAVDKLAVPSEMTSRSREKQLELF